MIPIKILHTADLHLFSSFKGLPAALANLRRRDLMQALVRLADTCKEEAVDLLVIAGDFWAEENVTRPLVEFVADQFRRIPSTTVFISPGQADEMAGGSGFYSHYPWPENVHIFSGGLTGIFLPHFNLRVYGRPWSATTSAPDWDKLRPEAGDDASLMIVAHGDPESLSLPAHFLSMDKLAYVALGGSHRQVAWGEKVKDPGCPEALDFGQESCGVLLGTIGPQCSLQFLPAKGRLLQQVRMDVSGSNCLEETAARIQQKLSPFNLERDIIQLILSGGRSQDWSLSSLQQLLPPGNVFILDETEGGHDYVGLEKEHGRGIVGKYIETLKGAQGDPGVTREALSIGLDALLTGRVAPW